MFSTHRKDRRTKPGSLPKSSTLIETVVALHGRVLHFSSFKACDALSNCVWWGISVYGWVLGLAETTATFLGASAKLRKATVRFVCPVFPFVLV